MSIDEGEMQHDGDDSDSDFEVISVNPNINYESDDDSVTEEQIPIKSEQPAMRREEQKEVKGSAVEDVSCDSLIAPLDDDNSNDSIKKVRKKLNLQEYKMRRANEKPQTALFDVPRKIAAYELCDAPASLPLLVLPTDSNSIQMLANVSEFKTEFRDPRTAMFNPDHYEEIIMVSTGCCTDISIPPMDEQDSNESQPTNQFLTNIVNNLNVESLLNPSTSLYSSIQAVVRGKAVEAESQPSCKNLDQTNEHGEDKIIMHLRKDRLRPFKCTVGMQTDKISLFPPLLLSPSLIFDRIRNARNYRRKISRSRSRSRSRSFSPSMEYDRIKYHSSSNRFSRSQHSTHSSSMNSSSSESDSDSSDTSSSSDSLKRFNDQQNFRFYNRNPRDQGYNYPGELCGLVALLKIFVYQNVFDSQKSVRLFTSAGWKKKPRKTKSEESFSNTAPSRRFRSI